VQIIICDGLGALPPFNPDLDEVSTSEVVGKPVALLNASAAGGTHAQAPLLETPEQ
jgi:hypothetical protein